VKDYHINIFYSEEDGGYIADSLIWKHVQHLEIHQTQRSNRSSLLRLLGLRQPALRVNLFHNPSTSL